MEKLARSILPERTVSERRRSRRYVLEFTLSLALFVVLSAVSEQTIGRQVGFWKTLNAVAPSVGVLGMALALFRFVATMDERQQQTLVKAGAFAGLATAVISMGLGLLADAQLITISMTSIVPMLALFLGLALVVLRLRE